MPDPVSTALSAVSLAVSVGTLWLTYLRRGAVKMTQPAAVFMGPDGGKNGGPKIYFRALLFSSSKRGQVLESLYVRVRRGESSQVFNVWAYGGRGNLERGSGLFVGADGVVFNHHFVLPKDGTTYAFLPGNYLIEVYARVLNGAKPVLLRKIELHLSEAISSQMGATSGVFFDWGPESQRYHAHLEPAREDAELSLFPFLRAMKELPAPPQACAAVAPALFVHQRPKLIDQQDAVDAFGTTTLKAAKGTLATWVYLHKSGEGIRKLENNRYVFSCATSAATPYKNALPFHAGPRNSIRRATHRGNSGWRTAKARTRRGPTLTARSFRLGGISSSSAGITRRTAWRL
jgi:hypothetical protein